MKTALLKFTALAIVSFASINSFAQKDTKTEKARKEVAEAQKELKLAKQDSIADYQAFKKDAEIKIANNEKKIVELKKEKSTENKEAKEKYDNKVAALEEKNNALKIKIKTADNTETSKWTSFKNEFNHDMNELGKAFKDLGVDNKK